MSKSLFCLYRRVDHEYADKKKGEKRGVTCNKSLQMDLNQGCCSYVACIVTIQLLGHARILMMPKPTNTIITNYAMHFAG